MTNKTNDRLFTHPLVMLLTHVIFPLVNLGGVGYIYWITKEALDPALHAKALWILGGAVAIPVLGAVASFFASKRKPGLWQMFAFAMLAAAYLYLSTCALPGITGKVDRWLISATPVFSMFAGLMPMIFSGAAAIALAKLSASRMSNIVGSIGLVVACPFVLFIIAQIPFRAWVYLASQSDTLAAVLSHMLVILFLALTFFFFVGLMRGLFEIARITLIPAYRTTRILIVALALPLGGLALNLHIPFPADFANPWPWALSAFTTLVLLPKPRADRLGLALYFLQSAAGSFVLYFFLLFVPFLPLSILAILAMGAGFLILAPTILFICYTHEMHNYFTKLRERYSARRIIAVAVAGFLLLPALFVIDVERERRDFKTLLAWHTQEDYDAPAQPLPFSQSRAESIMANVNDYTFGAEIPFLSAWRTFRVYDGMYLADRLRNELNERIFGKVFGDGRDEWHGMRNDFAAGLFGGNSARRSNHRARSWIVRPQRASGFTASAAQDDADDSLFIVTVEAAPEHGQKELILRFRLPAGAWIAGMDLLLEDGTWKKARVSERKAAEWVYRKITEQRLDPSIVTLDSPVEGVFKIFPVGENGRKARLSIRLPAPDAARELVRFTSKPYVLAAESDWTIVANPAFAEHPAVYRAKDAAVSVVGAEWMEANLERLVHPETVEAHVEISGKNAWSNLRRAVRKAARDFPETGVYTVFSITNEYDEVVRRLGNDRLDILARELPGESTLWDEAVEGWFFLEKTGGGRAAVPYRKGRGAVVFAPLAEAVEVGGKWAEGAKAWELENEAFLKPALDVRGELLAATRSSGALTTKSAYIAVETVAQEKGLRQKEAEALYGNQNLEFDEPETKSGDAPGLLLLLACLAVFFFFKAGRVCRGRSTWVRG